jgi:hypothetical protein
LLFIGIRLPPRQLVAAAVLALVAMIAINGVRVQQGRDIFYSDSGISGRISALGEGLVGGSSVSDAASCRRWARASRGSARVTCRSRC